MLSFTTTDILLTAVFIYALYWLGTTTIILLLLKRIYKLLKGMMK